MNKKLLLSLLTTFLFSTNANSENNKNTVNWDNFFIGHAWLPNTSGVLYFEHDFKNNPYKMCEDLKKQPWRLTMIDQESKEISRIKSVNLPSYKEKLPSNQFQKRMNKVAQELTHYCLRVNLAPVMDKGQRGYGSIYSKIFATELRKHNIVPTWKHFPGMGNNISVYNNSKYNSWYKNIYGEGVIESLSYQQVKNNTLAFKDNHWDVLMFSIGIFKNVEDKPIVFSEKIWNLAYNTQPNSLYIPDDLSELRLTSEQLVWLFKKFDLLLFTSPKDINWAKDTLQKAYKNNEITISELNLKLKRQNLWRKTNKFPLLVN